MCVDSRNPNNLTIKEPMLIALEPMLSAHDRRISGLPGPCQTKEYHWINTCENNKLKTAFRTRNGRLEYQTIDLLTVLSGLNKTLAEKLVVFVNDLLKTLTEPAPGAGLSFSSGLGPILKN